MIARRLARACALALCALPAVPWAQSLPPSLRACAAETDAGRRHACYDREVARILDAEKAASVRQSRAPAQNAASEAAPVTAARPTTSTSPSTPAQSADADRLSARIVSVDAGADQVILHLDNGDVWEQTDRTSGGLGLRAGDPVKIERHFGSYWLSARHVSGMRVRKRSN